MDATSIEDRKSGESITCSQCGRPLAMRTGAYLQTETAGAAICDDCYAEMLVPGPGGAHGSMS
jgi:formylmethanofuran dehydrogenase subunit E